MSEVGRAAANLPMRTETDSMGKMEVPADRYYGAQTARSLVHFAIGKDTMPPELIRAFGILKKAAALVNQDLGRHADEHERQRGDLESRDRDGRRGDGQQEADPSQR